MSDTRLIRVQEPKFGHPYVAFELRRYFAPELKSLVGKTLKVRKSQASGNILTAISPDGTTEFQLHAKPLIHANCEPILALRRHIARIGSDSYQTPDVL